MAFPTVKAQIVPQLHDGSMWQDIIMVENGHVCKIALDACHKCGDILVATSPHWDVLVCDTCQIAYKIEEETTCKKPVR